MTPLVQYMESIAAEWPSYKIEVLCAFDKNSRTISSRIQNQSPPQWKIRPLDAKLNLGFSQQLSLRHSNVCKLTIHAEA